MNRATLTYLVMFAAFGVGLWAVLRAGAGLEPPVDLAGTWEITASTAVPVGAAAAAAAAGPPQPAEALGRSFVIEQSGRYVRLHFASGERIDLKLTDALPGRAGGARDALLTVELTGGPWRVIGAGSPRHDAMRFSITGPTVAAAFEALRTERTYKFDRPE